MNTSEQESCSSNESVEDSFEELKEIESKLYSVIHYNNLSEIIASDLPEGIKIDISKSNQLTVSLTDYNLVSDSKLNSCMIDSELQIIDSNSSENCIEGDEVDFAGEKAKESDQNPRAVITETPVKVPSNALNCTSVCEDDDDVVFIETVPIAKKTSHDGNTKSDCVKTKMKTVSVDSNCINDSSNNILDHNTSEDNDPPTSVEPSSLMIDQSNVLINVSEAIGKKPDEIVISSEEENVSHETSNSTPERSKVKTKKKKKLDKQCPKKWSLSMIKYYTKISRKKLNFDSTKLIKEMRATVGRDGWFLKKKDTTSSPRSSNNRRCHRCRQFGHDPKKCREVVKPITCYICGVIGHTEHRCPERKCFTCGRPNSIFVQMCSRCLKAMWGGIGERCSICNSHSHQENLCPDIWRAFHLTTKEGKLVFPLSEYKPRKYCCNCATEGHLDYECEELRNSVYSDTKPTVSNYLAVAHMFATDKENLTVDVRLNAKEGSILGSEEGFEFLQNVSNSSMARLELVLESTTSSLILTGSQTQCKAVLDSVQSFIERKTPNSGSFHKHKKKSVLKKRRTI